MSPAELFAFIFILFVLFVACIIMGVAWGVNRLWKMWARCGMNRL